MKIKKFLLVVLLLIVLLSTVVFATEVQSEDETENVDEVYGSDLIQPRGSVDGETDEVEGEPVYTSLVDSENDDYYIDDDYLVFDQSVEISSKQIEGNLFVIGQTVEIKDTIIGGSVFVIAQELSFSNVNSIGSLYVVGQNIKTEGTSFSNIYTVSQNVEFGKSTSLLKNVYALAETCSYNAESGRNVSFMGNNFSIKDGAKVGGTLSVTSEKEPQIPTGANIGDYNYNKLENNAEVTIETESESSFSLVKKIVSYVVSTVLIALVILKIDSSMKEKVGTYTIGKLAINGLIGLGLIIGLPIAIIIALCTGLLTQISFAAIWVYLLAFSICSSIASIIIALMIAKKLGKEENKSIIILSAVVALAVSILKLIPVISGITGLILALVGFGCIFKLPFSKAEETK